MGKKRILKEIKIMEISAVDKPAQPGATATIMKRHSNDIIGKNVKMTTISGDHQHLIDMTDYEGRQISGGMTSYVENDEGEGMHAHPWVILPDGTIAIGMALGHKHEIDSVSKSHHLNGDKSMKFNKSLLTTAASVAVLVAKSGTDEASDWGDEEHTAIRKAAVDLNVVGILPNDGPLKLTKADEDDLDDDAKKKREKQLADEEAEKVKKRLARAEKIAELTAVEKGHFDTLDDAGKDSFLGLEKSDRTTAISKANEADPVIATIDGIEIRKSADPAMVAMAKRMVDLEKRAKIEKAAARGSEIEKRVDKLDKLPGKSDVKKALVGAVLDIEDGDIRKQAFEILKAANDRNDGDFKTGGSISKADAEDAETKIETMAKALVAENPELSEEQAFNKVLSTPDGRKLYAKMRTYEAEQDED